MQNYTNRDEPVYAGFFVRLAAYLIDAGIVAVALLFVKLPHWIAVMGLNENFWDRDLLFQFSAWDIIIYFLGKAYYVLLLYHSGATIGKKLLRIRVVGEGEKRPTLFCLLYRETIAKYLSQVVIFVGYFIIGPDREKRGFHDILCDTRVIYDFTDRKEKDGLYGGSCGSSLGHGLPGSGNKDRNAATAAPEKMEVDLNRRKTQEEGRDSENHKEWESETRKEPEAEGKSETHKELKSEWESETRKEPKAEGKSETHKELKSEWESETRKEPEAEGKSKIHKEPEGGKGWENQAVRDGRRIPNERTNKIAPQYKAADYGRPEPVWEEQKRAAGEKQEEERGDV